MYEVDVTPILEIGVEIAAAVLAVLAGWVLTRLAKLFGLKQDAEVRVYLNEALLKALAYGEAEARKYVQGSRLEVKSAIVAEGVAYAQETVPAAIKHFDITPERLADMLEARLQEADAAAAAEGPPVPEEPEEPPERSPYA